jgi:general secretion pathway protein J
MTRNRGSHRRAGVTLIELLIAVSLLGALSAGILLSLDLGLRSMEKTNNKVIANRRSLSVQRILRSQITDLLPAGADCHPAPNAPPVRVPMFEGQPETMRFVSTYSLQEAARGYPRLLEFQVISGERGEGVRLVVNEILYTGPAQAGRACIGLAPGAMPGVQIPRFSPPVAGPHSFVLADRLSSCRFAYLLAPPPGQGPERWVPAWQLPVWPAAVRIDMTPLEADPSRVQPGTVTAPIRIVRQFNVPYMD